ncbi:MAG: hypothetical protein KDD50_14155 [Bdellovibrionales bacterium]|nr:hypothetical protein [Bdellovibrionales bacterium]
MKVILLAGQFNTLKPYEKYPFTKNQSLLNWQINNLLNFTQDLVVVLDNEEADQTLRTTPLLMDCEIVFDTNGNQSSFFTNLESSLYLMQSFAAIIPVSTPVENTLILTKLYNHYHKYVNGKNFDGIHSYFIRNGQFKETFPIALTGLGKHHILNAPQLDFSFFKSLNFSPLPFIVEPHLDVISSVKNQLTPLGL